MAVPVARGLVELRDLAGRPRGTGFLADDRGTLLTSHEAVDGLSRLMLRAPDGRTALVEEDALTPLPDRDLALIRTVGLDVRPLVIATERLPGTEVRLWVGEGWSDATIGTTTDATYGTGERFHILEGVLELELPAHLSDAFCLSPRSSGAPVLDSATGAVVGVLGTALSGPRRARAYAVPLRTQPAALSVRDHAHLDALLSRNSARVPGYGTDLNLAGALQLTDASVAAALTTVPATGQPQERPATQAAFADFMGADGVVLALVGEPGTGRSTELASWALRRVSGPDPNPTLWLRGADLRAGDTGLHDAARRVLSEAGRIAGRLEHDGARPVARPPNPGRQAASPWPPPAHPDVVARLARTAGRPLLVMLDGPEEMPPHLAHQLRRWCVGTANWLRVSGARLVLACRPEFWEEAGRHFPDDLLYPGPPFHPASPRVGARPQQPSQPGRFAPMPVPQPSERRAIAPTHGSVFGLPLRPHVPLAPLPGGHPLITRILSQLRPVDQPKLPPHRQDVFEAWLALMSLRIATTLGAAHRPPVAGRALRRLAATASGRLHLAARRCLGPGQGALSRSEFEAVFPWNGGWAAAALSIGVLQPAGAGYRFSDEEFGDWLQGAHLELDAALDAFVHHPVRDAVPVPRHRVGPVIEALLLADRTAGPARLGPRLRELVDVAHRDADQGWWASRLLRQTLLRLPDAAPYLPVLRVLAARLLRGGGHPAFGPAFWGGLPLETAQLLVLLRQLLPLDGPPPVTEERYLDVVARLLSAEPAAVTPSLCRWFSDGRTLRASGATVASAAGALLHTHRRAAPDALADALVASLSTVGGAFARQLLEELAQDEPAALSRAVHRWARDERRTEAARQLRTLTDQPTADRHRLHDAARELLRHPDDAGTLHPAAYAQLLSDPATRPSHLSAALLRFAREPYDEDLARALVRALDSHPRQVLAAFRHRLCGPGPASRTASRGLLALFGEVRGPALARQLGEIVFELARARPESVPAPLTGYLLRRLAAGPSARAGLRHLARQLLVLPASAPRLALARALAAEADRNALAYELLADVLALEPEGPALEAARTAARRHPEPKPPTTVGDTRASAGTSLALRNT